MNQQNSPFPLFFTLERVENGYILTAKENTCSLSQEPKYRKEVVADDKICSRVGQLLNLEAMNKERPLLFHVEAVNEGTYKTDATVPSDNAAEAKLAFVHMKSKNIPADIAAKIDANQELMAKYGFFATPSMVWKNQQGEFKSAQGMMEDLREIFEK